MPVILQSLCRTFLQFAQTQNFTGNSARHFQAFVPDAAVVLEDTISGLGVHEKSDENAFVKFGGRL